MLPAAAIAAIGIAMSILLGMTLAAFALAALVALAFLTEHKPASEEEATVVSAGAAQPLEVNTTFTVLSWNLQFGAGRKREFFYDGGPAVHVPEADVRATMAKMREALAGAGPDIALLQEVDRNCKRTAYIDQLPAYVQGARAASYVSVPYHRSPFVPKPLTNPLGRVDMHLAILSRALLTHAVRRQLALKQTLRLVQVFDLKRALLTAEVEVAGLDKPLKIAVTHLDAFSYGDGTLSKQVAALEEWMASHAPDQPWILAGDFNLLPPSDSPDRLNESRPLYTDAKNPMERLIPRFREVLGDQLDPRNRTYLPFGDNAADRKIDYFFVGGPIEVIEARVMHEHKELSDHLPIMAMLRIRRGDERP